MYTVKGRTTKLILLVLLGCLAVVTIVSQSYAVEPDNPMVWTLDVLDNPTEVFAIGDIVRIKAYSHYYPYDILVNDQNNVTVWSDTSNAADYTMDVPGITTALGWWNIQAGTTETHFAVAWYHVIPEMPLGVVGVLFACFAGLGVHKIRRTKAAK